MKKHATVAIFIPHAGCGHTCSFCDQHRISGTESPPDAARVQAILEQAKVCLQKKPAQIAFFGGSFTALERGYMLTLLAAAKPFIDGEYYSGIRVSTRPDAISDGILEILGQYGVTDIELGAQSMDDAVLAANKRGHSATDTRLAAEKIKAKGFGLGLQMMTGLYADTPEKSMQTAQKLAALQPDCVRVYPALTLKNTELAQLYKLGRYQPQALEEAVLLCASLLEFFTGKGIPVIRLGLHDMPSLVENYIAGPHHPAFRELCESRILLQKVQRQIEEKRILPGEILLTVQPGARSKMAGQKRANLNCLQAMGYRAKITEQNGVAYLDVITQANSDFILRPWSQDDAENLAKYANNPRVAANLRDAFPHPYTLRDAKEYITMAEKTDSAKEICYAIEIDGAAAGGIGVFLKEDVYRKTAEIGYWLAEDFWGRGIMPAAVKQICAQAFAKFDLVRISAEVFGFNKASMRVLEKAGFTYEGTLRSSVFKNGKICDSCVYALVV